jgi:hypothetical protein
MLKYGEKKYRFLRKSISAFYEFGQFIRLFGPKAGIFKEAESYLKNNKVDAIIASGDPFVLFYYASKLSKEFNIPWIADYSAYSGGNCATHSGGNCATHSGGNCATFHDVNFA